MQLIVVFAVFVIGALHPAPIEAQSGNGNKRNTGIVVAKAGKSKAGANQKAERLAAVAAAASNAFPAFCEEWMQKLVVRERDNVARIKWDTKPEGVHGEYVGYSQEHTCTLKDNAEVPVGKISYREFRYEKRGGTAAEAEHSSAQPVEVTEVTEIFRYDKGKWVW